MASSQTETYGDNRTDLSGLTACVTVRLVMVFPMDISSFHVFRGRWCLQVVFNVALCCVCRFSGAIVENIDVNIMKCISASFFKLASVKCCQVLLLRCATRILFPIWFLAHLNERCPGGNCDLDVEADTQTTGRDLYRIPELPSDVLEKWHWPAQRHFWNISPSVSDCVALFFSAQMISISRSLPLQLSLHSVPTSG